MDVKIKDGDLVLSPDGYPETVSGLPLAVQQIAVALTVPKGSFVYDRSLGVCEGGCGGLSRENRKTLELMLNESFVGSKIYIRVNEISSVQNGKKVDFTVIGENSQTDSEVILIG